MPVLFPSNIDTDLGDIATLPSPAGLITSPPSPTTQGDIRDIFQREQDHAMSLLSLSPLLEGIFLSYANRVAALESAATPPPRESEEWKSLGDTFAALREENDRLKSEIRELARKLEAVGAPRDRVSFFKHANMTKRDDIESLRAELVEIEEKYDRFMAESNAEKAALQVQVLNLKAQRGDSKETIVEQQTKILRLERQSLKSPADLPTTVAYCELDNLESLKIAKASKRAERMTMGEREAAMQETAMEQVEQVVRKWVMEDMGNTDDVWAALIAGEETEMDGAETRALSPTPPSSTSTMSSYSVSTSEEGSSEPTFTRAQPNGRATPEIRWIGIFCGSKGGDV